MKPCKRRVFLSFLFLFIFLSLAFAEEQSHSYEEYLSGLRAQGKERIIVRFKDSADPTLIEKYDGKIIHILSIINAIACEIPQESIELLRKENAVESIGIDGIIKTDTEIRQISNTERKRFLKFKKEYFNKIERNRNAAIIMAMREYQRFVKKYPKLAFQLFKKKLQEAGEAYQSKANSWSIEVSKIMISAYHGPAAPEWQNLEAGLNAKAAWDRYNLDGTGIKVAFIDTGINYNLSDLGGGIGAGFKCLGGYDFVDNDSDPMPFIHQTDPNLSEWHGTDIAANCLGTGDSLVVGAAYNASYYALRVMGSGSSGAGSNAIAAIQWCLNPDGNTETTNDRPDIINMSFASYDSESNFEVVMLKDACNAAYNAGMILVSGSGNNGYNYSSWPAGFENVISTGGHANDQTLYNCDGYSSNGGVDFIAPGESLPSLPPEGAPLYYSSGTSGAAACASGLIALQFQYARQNNIQPNNGYIWELIKHSAKDMPLITDPNYRGGGKIWAADTAPTSPDNGDGSIDCMASKWPLNPFIEYLYYVYLKEGLYPAYYIGADMSYRVNLTNNTDTIGNHSSDIENLNVTATQAYYQHQDEVVLPGASACVFSEISSIMAGSLEILPDDSYYLPLTVVPGLNRTILDLGFEFTDDTNNRQIKVAYPYAGLWCPPPAINDVFLQ